MRNGEYVDGFGGLHKVRQIDKADVLNNHFEYIERE